MNTQKNIAVFALLCVTLGSFAGTGRFAIGNGIMRAPCILKEPLFWIIVVIGLVLVGIYYATKDKE